MTSSRDYNAEIQDTDRHRYAYDFDLEVMHGYMIKSFQPFFNGRKPARIGELQGRSHQAAAAVLQGRDLRRRLRCRASNEARRDLGDGVRVRSRHRFETASLPERYDNIVADPRARTRR